MESNMRHNLNKLTISIVILSLSPLTFTNTTSAATVTGNTVTYENEIITAPITQGGTATNDLQIKNTQVTVTGNQLSGISWPSAVSIGGNNGSLSLLGQGYGNLTISVDDQSSISAQTAGVGTALYVRSDSSNAIVTVNNAGTLSIDSTNTSNSGTYGILAENFGGDFVSGGGKVNVNLQSGSNINITTGSYVTGITANGREINVTTDQNSQVTLNNTTTSANSMNGLYVYARQDAFLENKGGITINAGQASGSKIGVNITSLKKATVINNGTITIMGSNGKAIGVSASSGDVTSTGNITVTGANANGIILNATDASETADQKLNVSGNITIDGAGAAVGSAVALNNQTQGKGIITYDDANGTISVTGNTTIQGANGPNGFFQTNNVGGDVLIDINNINAININSDNGIAIGSSSTGGTGNTVINFQNGIIRSTGNNADGINALNSNNGGDITVNQGGDIWTSGGESAQTEGIYVNKNSATGNVYINTTGNIDIDAKQGIGILTNVTDGSSTITVDNADKHIAVTSVGNTTTQQTIGILARAGNIGNSATVNITNADYINTVSQQGKAAAINTVATNGANSSIMLDNINSVTAQSDTGSVQTIGSQVTGAGTSAIVVSDNVNVVKATGNGQAISATTQTGTNTITLGNTKIEGGTGANGGGVYMASTTGNQSLTSYADISADNDQAIFGTSNAATTIDNYNKITGYTNFTGTGAVTFNNNSNVVLPNFGGTNTKSSIDNDFGTNGTFNNKGTINFSDKNNTGTITTASFNNVANFDHSGIIDLTTNSQGVPSFVGNTLQVTNGGNGNFVSNGGSLIVNTQFNGSTGTSDRLIVDNATTGTGGATTVYVNPTANSVYGNLTGNGIEVITVNGTSSSNAFALGRPVMNGVYQYGLYQGNAAGGAASQSWFLRNNNFNPVVGGYLANQTAATEMFSQQLRDRLLVMPASQDTSQLNTLWMRTKMTHGSYRSLSDSINNKNRLYMVQMGSDIGVWKLNDGNLHVGLMAGYGDYKNTSTVEETHSKADSKVKGYNAGVYATWFQNDDSNKGLYVDTWSQYGWYRNETSGKDVSGNKKYDSNTWSTSIETGYGLVLGTKDNLQWTATPQAQLTYNYYHADNLYDKANVLNVTNSKGSGLVTRVGLRIQAKDIQLQHPVEPFAEFNWINNSAKNDINFNGMKLSNGVPHNRYETKVGLIGNITPKFSVSAQVGGTWGDNKYKEYAGQLNLNYKF